jgi:hypothetical protein
VIEGSCHCGAAHWRMDAVPEAATACNCTVCRRYGVLWAYGYDGVDIHVSGPTRAYVRSDKAPLDFHFCETCGCVVCWRGLTPNDDGRTRIAVNLRLAEPDAVAGVVLDHYDGLETYEDLPRDGRCVRDVWF